MEKLLNLSNFFLDFLFPKTPTTKHLEEISKNNLVTIFPQPRHIDSDRVVALFDYQNKGVRDFVWEIKYRANKKLIKSAAIILYEILCIEVAERALFENFVNPLLIPMPMSTKQKRYRGYNQTEIICKEIMKLDQNHLLEYLPDSLIKTRHTESQAKTESKTKRQENLKNSMAIIGNEKLRNRCVVLIDDVYTTGATVAEATRALRDAKVRKILTFTIAH
jgi:ComF family protein